MAVILSTTTVVLSGVSNATRFMATVARFFSNKKNATHSHQPLLYLISDVVWKARGEGRGVNEAFVDIKKKLILAPIMSALDWSLSFEIMCDASNFAIGSVLGQRHKKIF